MTVLVFLFAFVTFVYLVAGRPSSAALFFVLLLLSAVVWRIEKVTR